MRNSHYLIILLAVTLFLFVFGLGNMALTDPDETFYAQTAREMLSAGEWITPTIFGRPQFEKPVLYYLLVVISYMVFGVSEFAARFPSAVFGIIGILGVYFLGRLLFSPFCGFLSGLVMATCVQYVILAKACVTDMVLNVFILFCMFFFLAGWTGGKKVNFFIASIIAALAVLTKGPIGLFIPGLTIFLYILLSRQWGGLKRVPVFWCILIFLTVSLPWYLIVNHIHGEAFTNEFFGLHNVTRFLTPEHRIGISPFFYIPVILGGFFPWSIFLLFGTWDMWKDRTGARVRAHKAFLFIWFLVIFLFFSASSTKLVTYIFPLFPVMAIMTGRYWERFIAAGNADKGIRGSMRAAYYIFIVVSILAAVGTVMLVNHEYPGTEAVKGAIIGMSVFLIGAVISLVFLLRGGRSSCFNTIIVTMLISSLPVLMYILPVVDVFETSKPLCDKVKELAKDSEPVGGEDDHRRGIAFYMDRTEVVDIHSYQNLKSFVSRKDRVWGIIQVKHYQQIKNNLPDKVSEPLFRSGKYVVITNKPLRGE